MNIFGIECDKCGVLAKHREDKLGWFGVTLTSYEKSFGNHVREKEDTVHICPACLSYAPEVVRQAMDEITKGKKDGLAKR